jgi:hypothetical protein
MSRNSVIAYLKSLAPNYPYGVPNNFQIASSESPAELTKAVFLVPKHLSDTDRHFLDAIVTKGLGLQKNQVKYISPGSDFQYKSILVVSFDIPTDDDRTDSSTFFRTESLSILQSDVEAKKQFWNELKIRKERL